MDDFKTYIREGKVIYKGKRYRQTFKIKKTIGGPFNFPPSEYSVKAYKGEGMFSSDWEFIDSGEDKSEADSIIRSYLDIGYNAIVKVKSNEDWFKTYYNDIVKYLENE